MPLNIIIREACESDLSSLVEYNLALARETENLDLNKDTLRLGIQNSFALQGCHYFAAETEGNVVGQTMITSEWSDWRNGTIWWMQSVYVHPDYRKRGVFHSIFKHIEIISSKNHSVNYALKLPNSFKPWFSKSKSICSFVPINTKPGNFFLLANLI